MAHHYVPRFYLRGFADAAAGTEPGVWTADGPVTWANPEATDPFYGSGLLARGTEVLWPVGRNSVLIASWNGRDEVVTVDADFVEKVNRRIISTA